MTLLSLSSSGDVVMPERHSLLPTTASWSCTRALLPLLLVALYCCAPAAPASSVVRQGPDAAAGLAERVGGHGVWLRGRTSFHSPETRVSSIPEAGDEPAGASTSAADGPVIGDYGGELQSTRYLHRRGEPQPRGTSHRSRKSLNVDRPESGNDERSSSSFFVPSDWSRGAGPLGREGARDIRSGNWPQEGRAFERVSSGEESERKASQGQHKSSIMEKTESRLAREEDHSQQGLGVMDGQWGEGEGSILESLHHDPHPARKLTHVNLDGSDNPVAPLEETLVGMGAVEDQDEDDTFNGQVDDVGNLRHSVPNIHPAVVPLRYADRGTMSHGSEGFSDSLGLTTRPSNLLTSLGEETSLEREEDVRREESSLLHHP